MPSVFKETLGIHNEKHNGNRGLSQKGMIKSLFIIIVTGVISFIYTDIQSSSVLYADILPLIVFIALVAFAVWFVVLFHNCGGNQIDGTRGADLSGFGGYDGGEGGSI